MFLVAAFDGFLQLRQRKQSVSSLELLLTFSAGKNNLPFPSSLTGFECICHSAELDADLL
jgi:hypothetical protein